MHGRRNNVLIFVSFNFHCNLIFFVLFLVGRYIILLHHYRLPNQEQQNITLYKVLSNTD